VNHELEERNSYFLLFFAAEEYTTPNILLGIKSHLTSSFHELHSYFSIMNIKEYDWIRNPFISVINADDVMLQNEAVELKNDRTRKLTFAEVSLNGSLSLSHYSFSLSLSLQNKTITKPIIFIHI